MAGTGLAGAGVKSLVLLGCGKMGGAMLEGWLKGTGMADVNLETCLEHPNYDEFWAELNPEAQAHRVNAPGVFIGGWYDIFLQGKINSFFSMLVQPGRQKGCHLKSGVRLSRKY